ncbi:unnamed protein product [Sphagnum balticum]
MIFVHLAALEPLFLQKLHFDIKSSIYFQKLSVLHHLSFLCLHSPRLNPLDFVSSLCQLRGQLVIRLCQHRILFEKTVVLVLEFLEFSELQSQNREFVGKSPVLAFDP